MYFYYNSLVMPDMCFLADQIWGIIDSFYVFNELGL